MSAPGPDTTAAEAGAGASPAPSVRLDGVAYAYPDGHLALHEVDLTIARGERVALLGPNGAGKTTLVLHLNGILVPQRGSVAISGLAVARDTVREVRRRVGLVFQDPDDQLFMPTVAEDVAFGPANFGVTGADLAARVDEALATVDMLDHRDRSPLHLSGGQRRRVALATVLACRPEVLVLDEPSSNLDPVARRELAEVLLGLGTTTPTTAPTTTPTTMLMVTHDLPYALQLCPRSVVIDEGRIVADGPTRELLADAALLRRHRLELPFGFTLA